MLSAPCHKSDVLEILLLVVHKQLIQICAKKLIPKPRAELESTQFDSPSSLAVDL